MTGHAVRIGGIARHSPDRSPQASRRPPLGALDNMDTHFPLETGFLLMLVC